MTQPGLGHGLALVDGDLVLAGGSLAEVRDLPNLVQALTLRVLTPFGTDIVNTGYGFDAATIFSRPANTRTVADLIRLNLVRTLATDARVREIRDVTVTPAAGRRLWTAEVSIVTVDGRPETVSLTVSMFAPQAPLRGGVTWPSSV